MKNSPVVTEVLFKAGEKCSNVCLTVHHVLTAAVSVQEKARCLFNLPLSHAESGGERLSTGIPCLRGCGFGDVRKIIGASVVACAENIHFFVNALHLYYLEDLMVLEFRDGCVFGLLDGLNRGLALREEGRLDFWKELKGLEVTGESALLLCLLGLLWQLHDNDALPPEKAGELTNLISAYIGNERGGGYKSPLRLNALSSFLTEACNVLEKSGHFPCQLCEAVVKEFLFKTFNILPMSERLELVGEAITCNPD